MSRLESKSVPVKPKPTTADYLRKKYLDGYEDGTAKNQSLRELASQIMSKNDKTLDDYKSLADVWAKIYNHKVLKVIFRTNAQGMAPAKSKKDITMDLASNMFNLPSDEELERWISEDGKDGKRVADVETLASGEADDEEEEDPLRDVSHKRTRMGEVESSSTSSSSSSAGPLAATSSLSLRMH